MLWGAHKLSTHKGRIRMAPTRLRAQPCVRAARVALLRKSGPAAQRGVQSELQRGVTGTGTQSELHR